MGSRFLCWFISPPEISSGLEQGEFVIAAREKTPHPEQLQGFGDRCQQQPSEGKNWGESPLRN